MSFEFRQIRVPCPKHGSRCRALQIEGFSRLYARVAFGIAVFYGWTCALRASVAGSFSGFAFPEFAQIEFVRPRVESTGFAYNLNGLAPRATNIIQASASLSDWINIATNDGSSASFLDTDAANYAGRYYRAVSSGPLGNPTNFTWTDVLNQVQASTNDLATVALLQSATSALFGSLVGSVAYARGPVGGVERGRDIPTGNVTNSYTDVYQHTFGQEYLWHWHQGLMQQSTNITAVFSGDSTTAAGNPGLPGAGDAPFLPSSLFQTLAWVGGFPLVKAVNDGVSGQSMKFWSTNEVYHDIAAKPDLLVLRWGANDATTPGENTPAAFENALTNGLTIFRASCPNCSILLMSPSTMADTENNGRNECWIESIVPAVKRAARAYNCAFLDTYAFWQDSRAPMATNYMDSIRVHPRASLNLLIASEIWKMCFPESLVKSYGVSQLYNRAMQLTLVVSGHLSGFPRML